MDKQQGIVKKLDKGGNVIEIVPTEIELIEETGMMIVRITTPSGYIPMEDGETVIFDPMVFRIQWND